MNPGRRSNEFVSRVRVAKGVIESEFTTSDSRHGTWTAPVPAEVAHVDAMLTDMWLRAHQSLGRSRAVTVSDPIRDLGGYLFDAVIPPPAQRAYRAMLFDQSDANGRVRLVLENDAAADVPWELLYDNERRDFVALYDRSALVRSRSANLHDRPPGTGPIDILVVTAEPRKTSLLTERDVALFRDLASRVPDRVRLRVLENADEEALERELATPCDVFYFTGTTPESSGEGDDENRRPSDDRDSLLLCARAGRPGRSGARFSAARLVDRFGAHAPRLAVFSACRSERIAWHVAGVAQCSIGVFGDAAAEDCIEFCGRLCEYLQSPGAIDGAITAARQSFDLAVPGARQWTRFLVHMESANGILFAGQPTFSMGTLPGAACDVGAGPPSASVGRLLRLKRMHEQNIGLIESRFPQGAPRPASADEQLKALREKVAGLDLELGQFGETR